MGYYDSSSAFLFSIHGDNDTAGNASLPPHLMGMTANSSAVNASASDHVRCVLTSRFYIHSVVAGVFCVTGIVTNAFSIAVLSRDRDTSAISSLLLRSLAGVDIFFLMSYICAWTVFYGFEYFGDVSVYHVAYHYLRLYTYPLIFVGQTATIWTTVLIAASRFIAVSLPYYAPTFCTLRSTRHRLVGVLVFSFVYNIPRFFELRIVESWRPPPHKGPYLTTEFGSSTGYRLIYFDICYYVFNFFLPLVLLTTFNLRLIADYRRLNRKRNRMFSSGRSSAARERHEQNLTLIMIIVIVVFVFCNSPSRVLQVVTSTLSDPKQLCPTRLFFLVELSSVLEILNSTVNFFVYFIFRKQFRHILQRELCASSTASASTSNGRRTTTSTTLVTTRMNGLKMETILNDSSHYQTLDK